MDIITQSEITLRQGGYDTWQWSGGRVPVVCFENSSILGFLHAFQSVHELAADWREVQKITLSRFVSALRLSGEKAWNVYSIFLTEQWDDSLGKRIEQIEEDFELTRKIARAGIGSAAKLQRALLSLLPIMSQPSLRQADFPDRLRTRLTNVPDSAVSAFVGSEIGRAHV